MEWRTARHGTTDRWERTQRNLSPSGANPQSNRTTERQNNRNGNASASAGEGDGAGSAAVQVDWRCGRDDWRGDKKSAGKVQGGEEELELRLDSPLHKDARRGWEELESKEG